MCSLFKEAIADCDKAINIDVTCSKAYFRKASALKSLGKFEAALESQTKGLQYDSANATALKDREALVNIKNKYQDAERNLANKQYTAALIATEGILKEIGTQVRELNLIKVNCMINLKRLEEALNLTNSMVITFLFSIDIINS